MRSHNHLRPGRLALALALALGLAAPAAAQGNVPPLVLGHTCSAQNGVRICKGDSPVTSFDGTPLDVDVTLPASGSGPFPTIAMLHGYGGSKTDFETTNGDARHPDGSIDSDNYHYNNVWFAQHGYAVLNYTARGFQGSCGPAPVNGAANAPNANTNPACYTATNKGYIHLKDQRIEAHDTQFLLGSLVDEGVAKPDALGVTGISYGGGESIELAYLNDRIRNKDATSSFSPWTSPTNHVPLHIAAAWPRWPWSDLVSSLLPNGRFLDFRNDTADLSQTPIGIPIQSYIAGLFASGDKTGMYAPPGTDMSADLNNWFTRVNAGEPYDGEPYVESIAAEIHDHHQGFGIPNSHAAPLLIENGWTDDLFPPAEALRVYNSLRAANPNAPVSLQFGDLGHSRGSNKLNTNQFFNDQGTAFFASRLQGDTTAAAPAPGAVSAMTQTCPLTTPAGGPFTAASWGALHPGAVRFGSAAGQTVSSAGGDPQVAQQFDPILGNFQSGGVGSNTACRTTAAKDDSGTAVYKGPVSQGYTLLGLPTVTAKVAITGTFAELDSRLWDIGPDGQQTLISRGAYRLTNDQSGTAITFQLHGNGWYFAPGHTPKLELLGRDAPYLRASNGQFSLTISDLTVELPTLEAPGVRPQVVAPVLGVGKSLGSRGLSGSCANKSKVRTASVRPRGRGLSVTVSRTARTTVEVLQASRGRHVMRWRTVARFVARRGTFAWSGKLRRGRLTDGIYVLRFRSGHDVRRVAVQRLHGRFRARPAFEQLDPCGLVSFYELSRPGFGGPSHVPVTVGYRLGRTGTASLRAFHGRRLIATWRTRRSRRGALVKLGLGRAHIPAGDVRLVLTATSGRARVTRTLVARRL